MGIAAALLVAPLGLAGPAAAAARAAEASALRAVTAPSVDVELPVAAFRVDPATGGANVALAAAGGTVSFVSSASWDGSGGEKLNDGALGTDRRTSTWLAASLDTNPLATLTLDRPYLLNGVRLRTADDYAPTYETAEVALSAAGLEVERFPVLRDANSMLSAASTSQAPTTPVTDAQVMITSNNGWATGLGELELVTGQVGGREVQFTDASTAGGRIVAWNWDFGDGTTSTEQNPTHTYAAAGDYRVSLSVIDDIGNNSAVVSHTQTVLDPIAPALDGPTEVDEGGYFQLIDQAVYAGPRAAAEYVWSSDAADAQIWPGTNWASFRPADSGTMTITATVTDSAGLVARADHRVTVRNVAPYGSISIADHSQPVYAGQDRAYYAYASDASAADARNLTCVLDAGDGREPITFAPCDETEVNLTYARAGTYTQTFTISDPDGATSTYTNTIEVLQQATYLNLYPVPGTVTADGATLRVRLWNASLHRPVEGATVTLTSGTFAQDLVTAADGTATVRVPFGSGRTVSATFADSVEFAGSTDTETLSAAAGTPADVFFMIDESGSMGPYQENVKRNVAYIVDELAKTLDPQVGIGGFGDSGDLYLPHIHVPATNKLDDVRAALDSLTVDGGTEPGLDAIITALNDGGMREGSGQCVVLIGDEPTQSAGATVDDVRAALAAQEAHLFSIVSPDFGAADYRQLAIDSGGAAFDIYQFGADPGPVLDALLEGCATAVLARPDLSVAVGDGTDVVRAGSMLSATIVVTNDGEVATTGTTVTATLPEGVTDIAAPGGVITPAGAGAPRATVTWDLGMVEQTASASLELSYRVAADAAEGTVLVLDVTVTDDGSQGGDLTPANNSATDLTTVQTDEQPPTDELNLWYLTDAVAGYPQLLVSPFPFGPATTDIYLGDWDGDGIDTPAYREGNVFHLGGADHGPLPVRSVAYGQPGDVVYVGDWDGDGTDTFAVRRGNEFFVSDTLDGGEADVRFWYGKLDDEVFVGDWDGDGTDTIAVRRGNAWHVRDTLTSGNATLVFWYGRPGEPVLVGDWDGDGRDTPAIRRGTQVHVRNTLTTGNATSVTVFAMDDEPVIVGDWDGDGKDTLGIYETWTVGHRAAPERSVD